MASSKRGGGKSAGGGRRQGRKAAEDQFQEDPAPAGHGEMGHNQEAWDDAHHSAMRRTHDLDKKIDTLMDLHIKPLREEKAEIKADVRNRFGTSTKMFNARYGIYRLEQEATDSGDNITLATIKRLWDATPIGGQVDMEAVLKKADAEIAAKAAAKTKAQNVEHTI